jgi:hypothetical protein
MQFQNNLGKIVIYPSDFQNELGYQINTNCFEVMEQELAKKYIKENDVVLELGARYGSVSCAINSKLNCKTNQVSVEPDDRVWNALERNRIVNKADFHIVKGFISNKKLGLTQLDSWIGYGATSIEDENSKIPSFSLKEITDKYNLNFNVLVADCEGFLETFFDENPTFCDNLRLVIFEADCVEKCNYAKIKEMLRNKGFNNLLDGDQNVWEINKEPVQESIQCLLLFDRGDRLGANISWYISTISLAIKNKFPIFIVKDLSTYAYANSIFVESLFSFISDHNNTNFGINYKNIQGMKAIVIEEDPEYFRKIVKNLINIKCDYISMFKNNILTEKFKENLNNLAKSRNYVLPYDREKTIVVHLRLDDRADKFVDSNTRRTLCHDIKNIIDNDSTNFDNIFDLKNLNIIIGQCAISETEIQSVINSVLSIYKDYEVIIVTNGTHTLPYKTIHNSDESYDLFLLSNSKILIGSMSSFSFAALLFGNHESVYFPIWDHLVCYGLTTKYDKTNNIHYF